MIAHVILFRARPDLTATGRQSISDALRAAASSIPGILRFRAGRRVRHGLPGYEHAMVEDFEYAVIVEFDDIEGLTAYLKHPAHAAAGRHFTESAAVSLAYDYDLEDLDTR